MSSLFVCVHVCMCVCLLSHLQNGLWDYEQYIVPTYPKCMRCQYNCSSTNCNIQIQGMRNLWFLFCLCKSQRYFIFGLIESSFLLEVSKLFLTFWMREKERVLPLVGPNLHETDLKFVFFFFFSSKERSHQSQHQAFMFKYLFQSCHVCKWTSLPFTAKKKKKVSKHSVIVGLVLWSLCVT